MGLSGLAFRYPVGSDKLIRPIYLHRHISSLSFSIFTWIFPRANIGCKRIPVTSAGIQKNGNMWKSLVGNLVNIVPWVFGLGTPQGHYSPGYPAGFSTYCRLEESRLSSLVNKQIVLRTYHRLLRCQLVLSKRLFKRFVTIWVVIIRFFLAIWVLEFCQKISFLSFVDIQFLIFVTIWGFRFCQNLGFEFCHNLSFFYFCHNLNFWILSLLKFFLQFDFWMIVTIQFFTLGHKMSFWVLSEFEF